MLTNALHGRLLLAGHTRRSPVLAAHWKLIGLRAEVGVEVDDGLIKVSSFYVFSDKCLNMLGVFLCARVSVIMLMRSVL